MSINSYVCVYVIPSKKFSISHYLIVKNKHKLLINLK